MEKKNIGLLILFTLCFSFIEIKAQSEDKAVISSSDNLKNLSNELLDTHLKWNDLLNTYKNHPLLNSQINASRYVPFLINYNLTDDFKLSEKLYLTPYNRKQTYLGLGMYNNIGASLKWNPFRNLSLEAGYFLSLQYGYVLSSRHITSGYNWGINYDITNRLQLNVYGQYVFSGNKDAFLNCGNELPKTNIGSSLQYKFEDNVKMGLGLEYYYDERENKWKSESKGKLLIGF